MQNLKSIGFMRSLCMGRIEQDLVFPFPTITAAESEVLAGVFDAIASWLKPYEAEFRKWDRVGEFPPKVIQEMRGLGLFSLIVPEAFGGLGLSNAAYSRTLQELAKFDSSIAITIGAHSSIGMRGLLLFGTPSQKAQYFPRLATGELIAAFCLTEPGAGSDAASIQTKAVLQGDHWLLSGQKLWITNGGLAEFFTVFARTEGTPGQITAFIVTKDMKGVTVSAHEDKMGLRASSTTTVYFDQVAVPVANVLGEAGKGFKVAMKILNSGRTGLGGGCVGGMKRLLALATRQANERSQFGKKIAEFELIQSKVSQIMVDCYAAEATVAMVAHLSDAGFEDYAVEAAISKVFATEALWRSADEALQLAGGNGYMCEFPYERIVRDCRINRIFEGTNDILRLFIALTAMNDVGQNLSAVASSLKGIFQEPIKGFGVLSDYGKRKFSNLTGVGGLQATLSKVHPRLKAEAQIFEDGVRELAAASERVLMRYGKKIIGQQLIAQRLADVMIDLFAMVCVLSRVTRSLETAAGSAAQVGDEVKIAVIFCGQAQNRMKAHLQLLDKNVDAPSRDIAHLAFQEEGYLWDTLAEKKAAAPEETATRLAKKVS